MDFPLCYTTDESRNCAHANKGGHQKAHQYSFTSSSTGFLGHNAILSVQGGFIKSCRIAYLKAGGTTKLNQTIHLRVKFSVDS
jgi:hypothetical protein